MSDHVTFHRYASPTAAPHVDELVTVYLDVYAAADAAFFNEDRYRRQLMGHMTAPRWEVVTATNGSTMVGYIYGFALSADTRWWGGLCTPVPDGYTTEDGQRTVAISEILVRAAWREQGIAGALHREFLAARVERRATLLVEPDNQAAQLAYRSWGWTKDAQLQPRWSGAPLYDVLTLDLASPTP